jgi:hypothetical protein
MHLQYISTTINTIHYFLYKDVISTITYRHRMRNITERDSEHDKQDGKTKERVEQSNSLYGYNCEESDS